MIVDTVLAETIIRSSQNNSTGKTTAREISLYFSIRFGINNFTAKFLKLALICLLCFISVQAQQNWRPCIRVVDGDTIVLDGNEKVRLIGVDTPETKDPRKPVQYFEKEAYEFTKKLVRGKRVRLEFDQNKTDKYGRTLAYVYLEDGTFLNAEIIKQGYGFAYTNFPFRYLGEFRQYEREAREGERGLWAAEEEKKPGISEDTIV